MTKPDPKLSNDRAQKQRDYAKYRWEFMRRDPEYRRDWEKAQEIRKRVKLEEGLKKVLEETGVMVYPPEYQEEYEQELALCKKYGLGLDRAYMFDPDKSFEELTEYSPDFYISMINPSAVTLSSPDKDPKKVRIDIDFNNVNSIAELIRHVSDRLQEHYETISQDKTQRYGGIDYDLLLEVGDLKEKEHLKHQEVAQKIDPRKFRENPESAIRNVGHYYKHYKELVNGGYKDLTFP